MHSFVFVCCQVGVEKFVKQDLAKHHPELTFAFSRPGFITMKVTSDSFDANQPLRSVFVRASGFSVGSINADVTSESERFAKVIELLPEQPYKHLHVWRRDKFVPGERGFEPFQQTESLELGKLLKMHAAANGASSLSKVAINRTAKNGDFVANLILVEPDQWFVGWHQANSLPTRWPGGVPPLQPKDDMISRAYLKLQEALRWSQMPVVPGDLCVELGSSPGGACLALLERDLRVIGVDPATMDKRVLDHPNFTHFRARAADLKRREFAEVRWLVSDTNIAPASALDSIEHIVMNRRVNIQGMLVTLKLLTEETKAEIDGCMDRVRSWGYRYVRARQLAFNRHEVCLFAAKSKGRMHFRRGRRTTTA